MLFIIVVLFILVAIYGSIQKQNQTMERIVESLELGKENLV